MSPLVRTLIHRLVASLVVLAGVSMLMFVIARVIPGDPARIALGPNATEAQVEALRHERHLDQPIPVQYWEYVREVAHGNLGNSLYSNRPVRKDIAQYLPATLELIFIAATMIVLIGIPVGVLSARYRGRLGDHLGRLGSIMGVSTPAFVWGVILQLVFAYFWRLFPIEGRLTASLPPPPPITGFFVVDSVLAGDGKTLIDSLHHLALPALALAMAGIGQTARLTRASMAETYRKPFIEMARAYGFHEFSHREPLRVQAGAGPRSHDPRSRYSGAAWQCVPGGERVRLAGPLTLRGRGHLAQGPRRNRRHGAHHRSGVPCSQYCSRFVGGGCQPTHPLRRRARMTPFADSPGWRAFRRDTMAMTGLTLVALVVSAALFADWIAPYPSHAGPVGDFGAMGEPPSGRFLLGTDTIGRDLLTRLIYAYRLSLEMAIVVLAIATPIGVVVGLLAGYLGPPWSYGLMRLTDVFLSIPPLVLAMSITGFLEPSAIHGMIAITAMWWPWYARLAYNLTRAERQEGYVVAAEIVGAGLPHILFREILPNCMPSIVTKMTVDVGFVILIASSMSFLGLGAQAPTPDLGSMVADGAKYMPDAWWLTVFPAIAILIVVMGFNLLGDGLREAADVAR